MKDIRESLRKLENQGEDYIWRTAKAAGEEIARLRAELSALRESASKEADEDDLTQQERSCLAVTTDWIAPFEVAAALYPYPNGASQEERKAVDRALESLRVKGLVKFSDANGTCRITDAGRARIVRSSETGAL